MKTTLSYRDKIILLVIIAVAILLAGIFIFIRPTMDKISTNKSTLATSQAEEERIRGIIEEIPTIEANIKTEYEDAKSLSNGFAQHRETYDADSFIQNLFTENAVQINSINATPAEAENIEFYYYTPNVVTYPLFEAADINGDLAKETTEKLKASTLLSEVELQQVEAYSLSISFKGQKAGVTNLLNAIKDLQENVLVTNFNVDDYTFGETQTDATLKGYSTGTMTIKFYVLEPLAEPSLD
ncbi:MAG: hypothetical protein ACI4WH_02330 [Oscillospiraceae bacterium]